MSTRIELKINTEKGNDVSLSNMSLATTKSFIVLLESITSIVENTPANDSIRIQVKEGSAQVDIEGTDAAMDMIVEDFNEVSNNQSRKPRIVHNWRNIQSLLIANGFGFEVNIHRANGVEPLLQKIKLAKAYRVKPKRRKSDTQIKFLKGKLIEIGGVRPNIHIHTIDGEKIIQCDEATAIKIKSFLYKEIRLSIWSKEAVETKPQLSFCDKYIHEHDYNELKEFISGTQDLSESEEFGKIHDKLISYLAPGDNRSIGKARKIIRLYIHPTTEIGILKSILVITKSFQNVAKLKDDREKIRALIEEKIGYSLV